MRNLLELRMERVNIEEVTLKEEWEDWEINQIKLFGGGVGRVLNVINGWLAENGSGRLRQVATVNPEFVMRAGEDREFARILREKTDLNVVDGIGLVWAKQIQISKFKYQNSNKNLKLLRIIWAGVRAGGEILRGRHRENLVTGVVLAERVAGLGAVVGLLGGWGNRAERAQNYLKAKWPDLKSVAIGSKYDGKTDEIMRIIQKNKVKILLVAYGMGKQEKWIDKNRESLVRAGVGIAVGVGRSFDYLSGDLKRAPAWMRKMGLEWFYSWLTDAERRRRKWELLKFGGRVLFKYVGS